MNNTVESSQIEQQIAELKKQLPKKVRKPKKLPVAVSEEEFVKLIKATKKEHHKIAFLLAFASGLRVSEIIKLEPRHIDLKERKILIELGKGSKDRIVPLAKGFKESHIKFLPLKIGVRALEKAFKGACKRAGLLLTKPSLHFHSLRHGFASHAIKQGINIKYLQVAMGHSNVATTNVYLQAEPKDVLKSFEELF